jgi:hypothetical protein
LFDEDIAVRGAFQSSIPGLDSRESSLTKVGIRRVFQDWRKTGRLDLRATEMVVRSALHWASAAALSQLLQLPAPSEEQRSLACTCGQASHNHQLHSKLVLTAVGGKKRLLDKGKIKNLVGVLRAIKFSVVSTKWLDNRARRSANILPANAAKMAALRCPVNYRTLHQQLRNRGEDSHRGQPLREGCGT